MIESGQIRCALIVAGESSRPLVEQTLRTLLTEPFDRNGIKPYFANLTIGSAAVGAVVCHENLVKGRRHRVLGGVALAETTHGDLCQGNRHGANALAMHTDSEALLVAGVGLAKKTWQAFCEATGWDVPTIDRFICHQVGSAHRRKLYESLGLDLAKDFSTFETQGNTGSVALPATLATAIESGAVEEGNKVALLGIGSGLNCMMLALEW